MTTNDLTRSELIEHMKARRIVIGAQRGERVHVTIDMGKTTTQGWIPRDWIKPMLDGQPMERKRR